jgi:hypothetical protein
MRSPGVTLVLALALASTACDVFTGPDSGTGRIRYINAVAASAGPLRFDLQGGPGARLGFAEQSAYLSARARQYSLVVTDDPGSWSLSGDLRLTNGYHTLVAFGLAAQPGAVLLSDQPLGGRAGQALLRFLHVGPGFTTELDLHIIAAAQPVDPAEAVAEAINFPWIQEHFAVPAGSWRLVLTNAGTTTVIHDTGPLGLGQQEAWTAVFFNAPDSSPRLLVLRDGR